jgi:peptidoglycan/xylan/chitin deacetylase (PgdA/CDA1 family)
VQVISIMYHDVVPPGDFAASGFAGPGADSYKLDQPEFRRHVAAIRAAVGEKPVTTVSRPWEWGGGVPLFLTFDDGGAGALEAAEVLEEYGWYGHFFVTTDRIGHRGFLTAPEVRILHERGHVIGSHSCSHPTRMSSCGPDRLRREWEDSARVLSEIVGEPVTVASVPGGYHSRKVAEAAAETGIRILFTSEPASRIATIDGCLVLGRYVVQRGMPPEVSAGLAAGRWMHRARQALFWNLKKAGKLAGGPMYLALREFILTR